jgi:hypothetical protein
VGIPNFYGFGSGLVGGQRVRFLVLSRLGADIQKFFQSGDRPLPLATALNIAIQIIDSLGNANNTRAGFLKSLWGLETEEEEGYRTGPPGYIGWRNSCLGIDSWAP